MNDTQATRAPIHLWIVGLLSLLWNGFSAGFTSFAIGNASI